MEQQDVERIAKRALTELGVVPAAVRVAKDTQPGIWRIEVGGQKTLHVRCSSGTTPQWVREQIVEQFLSR